MSVFVALPPENMFDLFIWPLLQVDVVVTTAGGIEEDLIKCLAPTYKGDFSLPGAQLRSKGLNRIGNLLVPNDNYCKFEDWIIPVFDQMLKEQSQEVFPVSSNDYSNAGMTAPSFLLYNLLFQIVFMP